MIARAKPVLNYSFQTGISRSISYEVKKEVKCSDTSIEKNHDQDFERRRSSMHEDRGYF